VDAIADKFFDNQGKKSTKVFSAKQGIDLYLVISNEKYESILDHLAIDDDNDSEDRLVRIINLLLCALMPCKILTSPLANLKGMWVRCQTSEIQKDWQEAKG